MSRQIRLYLDEDVVNNALVSALRRVGIDVVTTLEANRVSFSDKEQLAWSTEQGRVIYSFNRRDFYRLHSDFMVQGKTHAGIILARQQRYSVGNQLRGLSRLISEKSAENMIDQLVFLSAYIQN